MNDDKTVIMINSKQKKYRNKTLSFNDKTLKHTKNVLILGMIYNDILET